MLHRIIAGDAWRKTRLHDMRGNFIGVDGVMRDAPRAVIQAGSKRVLGRYPELPWIPYPAVRAFERIARPGWSVLEHGAGMSTLWWGRRVQRVHSIEADADWYRRVSAELNRQHLDNVTIEHRNDDCYSDLSAFADREFDLVVIDGHARERVATQAARLVKRPGYVYFDNSDFAAQWHEMYGEAEDILLAWANDIGATTRYFTGMPPATTTATQGLLISVPPAQ